MLSKLKNLKLSKITIISIAILISLALCFGFFYAALINQEKQKMEVSVLEISPYTEEVSISGKEITQNYAVTTINGKKYINNLNTVKLLLKGTDENYSGNSLTASNIVVKVGGSVVTPKIKTLGSAQNITNGVQYELTLAGIPGNGVLTVEVDANTLTDKSKNKNILTKFDSKIEVDNTAPTIAASDITYGDTLQITLSDSSSLVNKWAITSSNVLPTTGWNEITQTQKQTVTKTGLTVGTYYIWAKDSVENVSSKSIKVTGKSIDNSSISVALNPTTYTYDGTEKKPGITVKDGTNTLTVGTEYSFVYSNNINAGTGKVTITGKGNYTGTKVLNFTINKRAITVKAADGTKTYDGAALTNAAATLTEGTLVSGQSLTATATGSITNVGSTANTVSSAVVKSGTTDVSGNYTITKTNGTLTVNKRTLTVKAEAKSKTYGAGDPELTYTCSNQVSEQTPKFSGTLSRDAGENVGTYEIKQNTLALADNSPFLANNYTIAYIGANLTINKAATATAAAADKTYNGASQTGVTGSYVSWANSTTGIDAGSYTAIATPDENHAWSDGTTAAKSITWTMSAKEVAVTWGTTIFTYNGSAQGPTASAESGVTGETINVTRTTGTNAGSYTSTASISSVTGGRAKAGNYKLTENTKAFIINRATTATAAVADKTYNGESQTGVTGNYVSWGGTTAGIDAGSYTATATPDENHAWSDGTTAAKNITWTMSAKEVAVTWETITFTYNGAAQGPTATAESGVTGETINITRTTGTNAGSYTSTASISSVAGGRAKAENYKLTGAAKAFTINKANLTLTFSENSGSVSYQNGTGLFTVTPSGYVDSETGTLSVTSDNTDYITVTSENAATAKNNTAVTVGYKANQYTSSKINIIVFIAATTNYNGVSKNYEITISDSIAPTIRVSSNTTYAKSQNVTITLSDEGSGLAAGTYGITYVGIPATNGSITFKSLSIIVSTSGIKSASTSVTVSDGTGIYDGTAIVQSIVKDVSGNSLAAGTSVTGEQYLDNTAPELSDFKYAISDSKPSSYSSASYNVEFDITEGHSGMAGYYDTVDLSTSLSSTDSRWKAHTGKTIDINMKYGDTKKIWLKDNAGNVSYKTFSLSPVAVSTETDCYVLYPTLQSAIGTASSNSDLRKWNSFWNSYIIKKC